MKTRKENMRRYGFIVISLLALIGLGLVFTQNMTNAPEVVQEPKQAITQKSEEEKDIDSAKELLAQNQLEAALDIIRKNDKSISDQSALGKVWVELFIAVSEKLNNVEQLEILYNFFPQSFGDKENASILLGRYFLSSGKNENFLTLRSLWKDRETLKEDWFLIDVDHLITQQKYQEAQDLLKSASFTHDNEINRLIRLGFLCLESNPQQSWNYFTDALKSNLENPALRIYRARLLEAAGKKTLALAEYVGAVQVQPENEALRDQIAEYFLRNRQYVEAIQVWKEKLESSPVQTWVKAWFWSHTVQSENMDWNKEEIAANSVDPYFNYLIQLNNKSTLWDENSFNKIENAHLILAREQSAFWLRLLDALQNKQEDKALSLLQNESFQKDSWAPDLEEALRNILTFRMTGSLQTSNEESDDKRTGEIAFFNQIRNLSHAPDLQNLLTSDEVFSAAFLAAGWKEAALRLHKMDIMSEIMPEWVSISLTEAIRDIKGLAEALDFSKAQKKNPRLQILIAEMLFAQKQIGEAIENIQPYLSQNDTIGEEATRLLSLIYLKNQDYKKSKEAIHSHPSFARTTSGQEILARISLCEGDAQTADRIYSSLERKSAEAKSYLARKAFAEKDWIRAKELTQQLLLEYPTSQLIRQNMVKILESEGQI